MHRLWILILVPLFLAAENRSWWVGYLYEPKTVVTEYGDQFSAIEFLTCENASYFTDSQCKEVSENGGAFSRLADLNHDGIKERWSVGIAKYKTGKHPYANVVVVSDPTSKKVQQVLIVELDEPSFAVFTGDESNMTLSFCMLCGFFMHIKWENNKWALEFPDEE